MTTLQLARRWWANVWVQSLTSTLAITGLLVIVVNFPRAKPILEFEPKVQLGAFATVPLFVLTILQIRSAVRIHRASFVKDFVAKLHTDKELSSAFHQLIYTYSNERYEQFKRASSATDDQAIQQLQGNRQVGERLYDPDKFQGSEEERRLDAVLGYFDIIGYHCVTRVVDIEDVAPVLGFQLAALSTRTVIKDYLRSIPEYWRQSSFSRDAPMAVGPFRYLTVFLDDFREYNAKHQRKIEELNRRSLQR